MYKVKIGDKWIEVVDLYVCVVFVNGDKGVVVNLEEINLKKWKVNKKLKFKNLEDVIIYELYVCDFFI